MDFRFLLSGTIFSLVVYVRELSAATGVSVGVRSISVQNNGEFTFTSLVMMIVYVVIFIVLFNLFLKLLRLAYEVFTV